MNDSGQITASNPPKRKLRRWYYGLISLLAVVVIIPSVVAGYRNHLRIESFVYFEQTHGWDPYDPNSLVHIARGGPDWMRRLVGDRWMLGFDQFVKIQLFRNATDQDLQYLSRHPELQILNLDHSHVTDLGLSYIQNRLVLLQNLELKGTGITDEGLGYLENMDQLILLRLTNTGITDAGVKSLLEMESLEVLLLDHTAITDKGVLEICEHCPRLRILGLRGTQITDEGLQRIRRLKRLESLYLDGTNISDKALSYIRQNENRIYVGLERTRLAGQRVY